MLILDTGLRISEALNLRRGDGNADNLILKVFGKGQKERLVPFSPKLRKRLYRFEKLKAQKGVRGDFVLGFSAARWEKRNSSASLSVAGETRAPEVRLASAPAHVSHELLTSLRRRHRATLDGPRAYADHRSAHDVLSLRVGLWYPVSPWRARRGKNG